MTPCAYCHANPHHETCAAVVLLANISQLARVEDLWRPSKDGALLFIAEALDAARQSERERIGRIVHGLLIGCDGSICVGRCCNVEHATAMRLLAAICDDDSK